MDLKVGRNACQSEFLRVELNHFSQPVGAYQRGHFHNCLLNTDGNYLKKKNRHVKADKIGHR